MVKNWPAKQGMQEMQTGSLGQEDLPGEGNGNALQYSCLEKSHGQRSPVGYSPWGHKELDTTEHSTGISASLYPTPLLLFQ